MTKDLPEYVNDYPIFSSPVCQFRGNAVDIQDSSTDIDSSVLKGTNAKVWQEALEMSKELLSWIHAFKTDSRSTNSGL